MTQAPGPITLSPPQSDPLPHAYVRMRYTQSCECCGTIVEHTRLFTKTRIRSTESDRLVNGSMMRVCNEPIRYNLPVLTQNAEPEILSICVHCTDEQIAAHAAKLPPVPEITDEWLDQQIANTELEMAKHIPGSIARRPYQEELERFRRAKARLAARLAKPTTTRESQPRIRTVDDLIAAIS